MVAFWTDRGSRPTLHLLNRDGHFAHQYIEFVGRPPADLNPHLVTKPWSYIHAATVARGQRN